MSSTHEAARRIDLYLLGALAEAEQMSIEQDYFADPEMLEQVWAAENELIDRYVRSRLSGEESALFERNYLQSPFHRTRVALARKILAAAESPSEAGPVPKTEFRGKGMATLVLSRFEGVARYRPLQQALAASILILLVAGFGWLAVDRSRLAHRLGNLESELANRRRGQAEIEGRLAAEREQSGRLKSEIGRLRQEVTQGSSRPSPPKYGSMLSLVLSPVLPRGNGPAQEIEVAPDTESIRLEMLLDSNQTGPFQAAVRTVEGKHVWISKSIRTENATIFVNIPAVLLPAGDYILTLSAGPPGDIEEVNRYFFRIIRK